MFHSSAYPEVTLWNCTLVLVLVVLETCLKPLREMHHVLCLLTKLMLLVDKEVQDLVAETTKENKL